MAILSVILELAGATMLLLYAVRMVRTGIERSFGAAFQRVITNQTSLLKSSAAGLGMAIILQSSAAVALLVAGFSTGGLLSFAPGLAVVLGGDLGSALLIQLLSFKLEWLVPLLLALGGWLFIKNHRRRIRQFGRILLGIAFILISLRFLREAVEPIRESAFLPAISDYLASDFITAFIVGGGLAFIMHSSVATILMCVTLVSIHAVPLEAGVSLMLGANLGSALIPIWLTRGMPPLARRVPFANLGLRGAWAVMVLLALNAVPLHLNIAGVQPGQVLIYVHIAFNFSLVLFAIPLSGAVERLVHLALPDIPQSPMGDEDGDPSALDFSVVDNPTLALASLKREILRMGTLIDRMMGPLIDLYGSGDSERLLRLGGLESQVNKALADIKLYVAAMPFREMSKPDRKTARELAEYAISLENAGDIVARRLLPLAQDIQKRGLRFSKEGWAELRHMHETVLGNMRLATNVLLTDDVESARLLVAEKSEISRLEHRSRKKHLKRLANGDAASFDSSDVHLETLRGLKDVNSYYSSIAYPILYRSGQLLETRLIDHMDEDHNNP